MLGSHAPVSLSIGGKLDHLNAEPLEVEATVYSVSAEESEYEAYHQTDPAPRTNIMPRESRSLPSAVRPC